MERKEEFARLFRLFSDKHERIVKRTEVCLDYIKTAEKCQKVYDFCDGHMLQGIISLVLSINDFVDSVKKVNIAIMPANIYFNAQFYCKAMMIMQNRIANIKTQSGKDDFPLNDKNVESFDTVVKYGFADCRNMIQTSERYSYIDLHKSLVSLGNDHDRLNGMTKSAIMSALQQGVESCESLSDIWRSMGIVRMIEEGTRFYAHKVRKSEFEKIKKQTRNLYEECQPKLTQDHWWKMKQTEDKALSLASRGKLVSAKDECLDYYEDELREIMDANRKLVERLSELTPDDRLFDFKEALSGESDLPDYLDYSNIDLFCHLVLRGNIIRCNLYPELKPKFEAWLKGEEPCEEVKPEPVIREKKAGPLDTQKAMKLWKRLQDAEYVDKNRMPKVSAPKAAIIASVMAGILNLKPRWGAFEELWGIEDLANKLVRSQSSNYYDSFLKKIENLLE